MANNIHKVEMPERDKTFFKNHNTTRRKGVLFVVVVLITKRVVKRSFATIVIFTGQYRSPAHLKCYLDCCFKDFKTPVFFHNLKNYDT